MEAEDGIRDLVRSRGLGEGYKRQERGREREREGERERAREREREREREGERERERCLLYTCEAAEEGESVDHVVRFVIQKTH